MLNVKTNRTISDIGIDAERFKEQVAKIFTDKVNEYAEQTLEGGVEDDTNEE